MVSHLPSHKGLKIQTRFAPIQTTEIQDYLKVSSRSSTNGHLFKSGLFPGGFLPPGPKNSRTVPSFRKFRFGAQNVARISTSNLALGLEPKIVARTSTSNLVLGFWNPKTSLELPPQIWFGVSGPPVDSVSVVRRPSCWGLITTLPSKVLRCSLASACSCSCSCSWTRRRRRSRAVSTPTPPPPGGKRKGMRTLSVICEETQKKEVMICC